MKSFIILVITALDRLEGVNTIDIYNETILIFTLCRVIFNEVFSEDLE